MAFNDEVGTASISPDGDGVQDGGEFSFVPNMRGVWRIIIDTDRDGAFDGARDLALRGRVDRPGVEVRVPFDGRGPDGEVLAFTVPQLAVSADGNFGGTAVRLRLRPETLLLLPDERLGVLVFRASFHVAAVHTKGRALRLRVDEGWYGASAP